MRTGSPAARPSTSTGPNVCEALASCVATRSSVTGRERSRRPAPTSAAAARAGTTPTGSAKSIGTSTSSVGTAAPVPISNSTRETAGIHRDVEHGDGNRELRPLVQEAPRTARRRRRTPRRARRTSAAHGARAGRACGRGPPGRARPRPGFHPSHGSHPTDRCGRDFPRSRDPQGRFSTPKGDASAIWNTQDAVRVQRLLTSGAAQSREAPLRTEIAARTESATSTNWRNESVTRKLGLLVSAFALAGSIIAGSASADLVPVPARR